MDDFIEYLPPRQVDSPCVNICRIDMATGWCFGCGRSLDEIGGWLDGSDGWRASVSARLPERMRILRRTASEGPPGAP